MLSTHLSHRYLHPIYISTTGMISPILSHFTLSLEEMRALVALVCLVVAFECINAYRGPFNKLFPQQKPTVIELEDDPGEPLFLTPYLEQGKIEEARRLR